VLLGKSGLNIRPGTGANTEDSRAIKWTVSRRARKGAGDVMIGVAPTTWIVPAEFEGRCCASATIGHATAPPSPEMNSRRRIRHPLKLQLRRAYRGLGCLGTGLRTETACEPSPRLQPKPPTGPDWVNEIKHDGYRLIVRR
jgi:hypothetical protein